MPSTGPTSATVRSVTMRAHGLAGRAFAWVGDGDIPRLLWQGLSAADSTGWRGSGVSARVGACVWGGGGPWWCGGWGGGGFDPAAERAGADPGAGVGVTGGRGAIAGDGHRAGRGDGGDAGPVRDYG